MKIYKYPPSFFNNYALQFLINNLMTTLQHLILLVLKTWEQSRNYARTTGKAPRDPRLFQVLWKGKNKR